MADVRYCGGEIWKDFKHIEIELEDVHEAGRLYAMATTEAKDAVNRNDWDAAEMFISLRRGLIDAIESWKKEMEAI